MAVERAIASYTQALAIRTREASPKDWSEIQNNLGIAYVERVLDNKADNLEQAIQHFSLALTVRTREANAEAWAATQGNMANACFDRIRGDRGDNISRQIAAGLQLCQSLADQFGNVIFHQILFTGKFFELLGVGGEFAQVFIYLIGLGFVEIALKPELAYLVVVFVLREKVVLIKEYHPHQKGSSNPKKLVFKKRYKALHNTGAKIYLKLKQNFGCGNRDY